MRRQTGRLAKCAREVAYRQTAFAGDILQRDLSIEVGIQDLLGTLFLPRREPTLYGIRNGPHAAVSVRHMSRHGERDVINE